jgi:hypothetical protein
LAKVAARTKVKSALVLLINSFNGIGIELIEDLCERSALGSVKPWQVFWRNLSKYGV